MVLWVVGSFLPHSQPTNTPPPTPPTVLNPLNLDQPSLNPSWKRRRKRQIIPIEEPFLSGSRREWNEWMMLWVDREGVVEVGGV